MKGGTLMAKTKLKRKKEKKWIDLSSRKNLEIIHISEEERELIDEEYKKMFAEISRAIDEDVQRFLDDLHKTMDEILSKDPPVVDLTNEDQEDLLEKYSFLFKELKDNKTPD